VPIAECFRDYYQLKSGDRVLDVPCAKGFLLHDLKQVIPGIQTYGLDISHYLRQPTAWTFRTRP
jgi:protein-L-isoaspartate(D-aspartate) O-methyltransferase